MADYTWILSFFRNVEELGIPVVYLRNYEHLPADVGNDVDLLVAPDRLLDVKRALISSARTGGWAYLRTLEFGPLSLFFRKVDTQEFLHVDLFSSLEIHWLPHADTQGILRRRHWNGKVFTPDPLDEVFLNVTTRLFYQGRVRDKHREQTAQVIKKTGDSPLITVARSHVGERLASRIVLPIVEGEWDALEGEATALRRMLLAHDLMYRRRETGVSIMRYIRRSARRLISPPGPFVVLEGADGVGKSTLIAGLMPIMGAMTGHSDTLLFHWKPKRSSIRRPGESAGSACLPRGKRARPMAVSLVFLAYHWFGFWYGYLRYLLPARARNRAIVGDRYADEFFLDPIRLRLKLPGWILRFAAATVPRPDMIICMVADPSVVSRRKKELSEEEIFHYQERLKSLSIRDGTSRLLTADEEPEDVIACAKVLLLERFACRAHSS